jgi:hypothetical protein
MICVLESRGQRAAEVARGWPELLLGPEHGVVIAFLASATAGVVGAMDSLHVTREISISRYI